ncbi:MerR family DNA-binding protein [Catenovulum agarivorans]|uniref:MerR family DNA-binding protein n=1 Tax=Catenovulum agarivorans TaxID=1172192 RepID=UPI0002DA0B7F|nr:MerR family DNA-binding protein [Catenovulum agarivorans]
MLQVNELAKALNTTADTVRYYARLGLITATKSANGYKLFNSEQQARLRFILSARQLGFSVADISDILDKADCGQSACPTVRKLIEQRLHEVEEKIKQMQQLHQKMTLALESWQDQQDQLPDSEHICHLIGSFQQ